MDFDDIIIFSLFYSLFKKKKTKNEEELSNKISADSLLCHYIPNETYGFYLDDFLRCLEGEICSLTKSYKNIDNLNRKERDRIIHNISYLCYEYMYYILKNKEINKFLRKKDRDYDESIEHTIFYFKNHKGSFKRYLMNQKIIHENLGDILDEIDNYKLLSISSGTPKSFNNRSFVLECNIDDSLSRQHVIEYPIDLLDSLNDEMEFFYVSRDNKRYVIKDKSTNEKIMSLNTSRLSRMKYEVHSRDYLVSYNNNERIEVYRNTFNSDELKMVGVVNVFFPTSKSKDISYFYVNQAYSYSTNTVTPKDRELLRLLSIIITQKRTRYKFNDLEVDETDILAYLLFLSILD